MLKIKCPECGHEIELNQEQHDALLRNIETQEVESRVAQRVEEIKANLEAQQKLSTNIYKMQKDKTISDLENKIALL